jgi:hypothetical protein
VSASRSSVGIGKAVIPLNDEQRLWSGVPRLLLNRQQPCHLTKSLTNAHHTFQALSTGT